MSHVTQVTLPLLLVLAGCDTDGSSPATDAGDPSSADGSVDSAPAPTKRGWLDVQLLPSGFSNSADTSIYGAFIASDGACTHRILANCEVQRCPVGVLPVLADPGKLTVGPFPGGGQFGWEPGAFPIYFSADIIPWAADEVIKIGGAGDDVPAFATSLPSPRTLDAGYDGPRSSQPLDRTMQLPVSWQPAVGNVVVTIDQTRADSLPRTQISCTFAGSTGGAWIPTDVLAFLATTPAVWTTGDVELRAWLATTANVDAGDYRIRVRALRSFDDQRTSYIVR